LGVGPQWVGPSMNWHERNNRLQHEHKKEMEEELAAFPAPQFEYDLAAPEIVSDDNEDREAAQRKMETDQAEINAEEHC